MRHSYSSWRLFILVLGCSIATVLAVDTTSTRPPKPSPHGPVRCDPKPPIAWAMSDLGSLAPNRAGGGLMTGYWWSQPLGAQTAPLDSSRWSELREALRYEETRSEEPTESEEQNVELGPTAKYLLIGVLVAGLGLLLYFVLRDYWRKPRISAKAEPAVHPEELDEDRLTLRETDDLIARAEANGQWAVAIRLHFLALLKDLQEQGRITWRRDKTNRDYRYELDEAPDVAAFAELTTAYESAWYGDHSPQEPRYRRLAKAFLEFRRNSRSYALTARP